MPGIPSHWASRLSHIDFSFQEESFYMWCGYLEWKNNCVTLDSKSMKRRNSIRLSSILSFVCSLILTLLILRFDIVFIAIFLSYITYSIPGEKIMIWFFVESFRTRTHFYSKADDFKTRRKWNSPLDKLGLWLTFDEDLKMRAKTKPVYKISLHRI